MYRAIQHGLLALYGVLPLAMVAWAIWRHRQGRYAPLFTAVMAFFSGFAIAAVLIYANTKLMGGRIPVTEALGLIYMTIAALCLLKFTDKLLLQGIYRVTRVPLSPFGRPLKPHARRALAGLLVQRLLMLAIIIPYAFALLLIYRPKIASPYSPADLKLAFDDASFTSADGVRLAAWWIPAAEMPPVRSGSTLDEVSPSPRDEGDSDAPDADVPPEFGPLLRSLPRRRPWSVSPQVAAQWGKRTVVLCHGVGAGKEHVLGLVWLLAKCGYNVLAFDFRGHGESGGNFISYGDRERQDVLAAVRWLKVNHPRQAQKIFGIGMNSGAAALLEAAADGGEGKSIDAIVLIEPFARFTSVVNSDTGRMLPKPIAWMVDNISLPLAALHSGSDLRAFAPVDDIQRIWPRPILIIHGRGSTFIPTVEEMELYRSASQPKDQFWPADNRPEASRRWMKLKSDETNVFIHMMREWMGTYETTWGDRGVQYHTLRFLREAEETPVI